jgi:hypothetical protein
VAKNSSYFLNIKIFLFSNIVLHKLILNLHLNGLKIEIQITNTTFSKTNLLFLIDESSFDPEFPASCGGTFRGRRRSSRFTGRSGCCCTRCLVSRKSSIGYEDS